VPPPKTPHPAAPPPAAPAAARLLSIVGHPAVVMPLAVPLAAVRRDAPWPMLLVSLGLALGVTAIVGLYSWWQVRTGRWSHVDASVPRERRDLNVFVVSLLGLLAAALWFARQPAALVVGLGAAAGIVLVALALQRRLKVSLHGAFGTFAAALAWPVDWAVAGLGTLALAVGWSRLRLGRHDAAEVIVGLCLGCLAGIAFHWGAGLAGVA
jgi:membrane-associated phospholipid phosphatase